VQELAKEGAEQDLADVHRGELVLLQQVAEE